ncbi:TetR/AcrR family transcriptional regulator [Kitasatospora sp. NBC_01539]|uniref:TetR/AcrR family transcriptional regulator n=1 Tax=Kitasatospora sp. NBC_01539 TaxID=2903577 RepID=UPI003860241D
MTEDDNGLRARLVQVGVDLLAAEGMQALTLREIARRAGVSHGAPRRYFPTHLELLSAIARRGFADLAARAATAGRPDNAAATPATPAAPGPGGPDDPGSTDGDGPPPDPRARLLALGRTYLDFARTEPGMFDLMFRHDLLESNALGLRDTSLPLFGLLTDLIAAVRPVPPSGAAPRVTAGALWANLHGIAQLRAWGSLALATGSDDVEPLLRAALDAHLGPEPGTRTPAARGERP